MDNSPVDLLRGAINDAAPNFARVTTDHLDLPTPCEGWDLRTLLNHAYSRLDLSARTARNEPVDDFAQVEIDHVGDDPAGAFERLTAAVLTAWDATDDLETPRVTPMGPMPPGGILLFGAQDIFIHAWDVATTIGATPESSDEMIDVFTRTHQESIDEATRAMFFTDAVPVPDDASPLDKLVAFLGRRPSTTAPLRRPSPSWAEAMSFTGFDPAAIALLTELPDWDADQYSSRKAKLAAGLTKPGLALIQDVAGRLDAELTVTSRSSVSPLHRDRRFAPEGSPHYKDHLLLTTWEGADKRTAPTLWIRIDSTRAGFASGIGFTPEIRDRWRAAVGGDEGADLQAILDRLMAAREIDIAGAELKRVPAPFDAEHPRADLLRKTGFQVRFTEDLPDAIGSPSFANWCTERLQALLPVHHWLTRQLT